MPFGDAGSASDAAETGPSLAAFDFSGYDLEGLRVDVRSLVNAGQSLSSLARWAAVTSLGLLVLTFVVFVTRMSGLWLFLFMIGAVPLAVLAGVGLGAWWLLRGHLETVDRASSRVLAIIGDIHRDIALVRAGAATATVQQLAIGILEQAVLPGLFGTLDVAATVAAPGPLKLLVNPSRRLTERWVERTVIRAVEALPDREIGHAVQGAESVVVALSDEYDRVRSRLMRIATRTGLALALGPAIACSFGLLLWWAMGVLLT